MGHGQTSFSGPCKDVQSSCLLNMSKAPGTCAGVGRAVALRMCWPCRYMADQVIGFLQDIAAAVMAVWHRRELPHREVEGEIIRPPMFEGNWGNKPERCLVDEAFKGLVADPVVSLPPGILNFKVWGSLGWQWQWQLMGRVACGWDTDMWGSHCSLDAAPLVGMNRAFKGGARSSTPASHPDALSSWCKM